jgi:hypothetical protein
LKILINKKDGLYKTKSLLLTTFFILALLGEFKDPFGDKEKFNNFFTLLPGIMIVKPSLSYYKQGHPGKEFSSEGAIQKLANAYKQLPAYGYIFKKDDKEQFFSFSHDRKLPNSFEKLAWEEI